MTNGLRSVMNCACEIYRNCARILISADLLMEQRGFSRYNWSHLGDGIPIDQHWRGKILSLRDAEAALAGYLFHQYFAVDQKDKASSRFVRLRGEVGNQERFVQFVAALGSLPARHPMKSIGLERCRFGKSKTKLTENFTTTILTNVA